MKESVWSLILTMVSISVLSANIYDVAAISIDSVSQVQETCDLSNGSLTVHVSGSTVGLEYSIDGGMTWQSSNFFGGLPNNDYLVLARDIFGCSDVFTAQISDALDPEVELLVECVPGRNLSVIIPTVMNGTPRYQFNWEGPSGNSNQDTLKNIPPGFYSVTVTDRLGCSITDTITVSPCCELNVTCGIQPIEVDCIADIPALDSILVRPATEEADLLTNLEILGIDLRPDFCQVLKIGVTETETAPTVCSDGPLIINRVYSVSDDFFSYDCSQEIRVLKSIAPIISNEAESIVIDCGGTLESQFQDWLDSNANMLLDGCSEPYLYSTDPELPVPPASCNELVEVTFIVVDACQNELRSTASFTMQDNGAPTIFCPGTLELEPTDPLIESKIDDWLETVSVFDNCNDATPTNDYFPGSLVIDCDQSLTIDVTFEAVDGCANISSCAAAIVINGRPAPTLSCGDDLTLACNEDRLDSFDDWIANFSAMDGDGNDLDISNDLDPTVLTGLNCNEDLGILFSITDDCGRDLECLRILTVVDTENPEINCPTDIEIIASDPTAEDQINAWLLDYNVSDNCDDNPTVANNFSLPTDFCEVTEAIEVTFDAVDICNNTANCTTQLTVINDIAELNCPSPLTLECGEATEEIVSEWLDQVDVTNATGLPTHDYPGLDNLTGCTPAIDITYTAESICGSAATCTTTLNVFDTTPPVLNCPDNLDVDLVNEQAEGLVNLWIAEANATDCSEFSLSNDFDLDLDAVICDEEQLVTFRAEDACGLVSTCNSRLILSNEGTVAITCPESIILTCSQGDFDRAIQAHLSQVNVIADNAYDLEVGDIPEVTSECETVFSISIEVSAIDICGNEDNCVARIDIQPEPEIYIPNIISPDGDGRNDYFNAFGNESIDYVKTMLIYNRWGDKIYEASDLPINDSQTGWDGRFNDVAESAQVFTYMLEIIDMSGNTITRAGTVHVIK